jgi:hypothetical protein
VLGVDVHKWNELNGFDEIYSPGYGEEVDLGERMCMKGYINVLADQVWVSHKKSASFGNSQAIQKTRESHEEIVNRRFPAYRDKTSFSATTSKSALSRVIADSQTIFFGISDFSIGKTIFSEELQRVQLINQSIHEIEPTPTKIVYSSRIGAEDFQIAEEDILIILADELFSIENQYRDVNDELWKIRRDRTFTLFERANSIVWKSESVFNIGRGIFGDLSQATNLIHVNISSSSIECSRDLWLSALLPIIFYETTYRDSQRLRCNDCPEVFCDHELSAAFLLKKPIRFQNQPTSRRIPYNSYENQYNQSGNIGKFILFILSKYQFINKTIIPIGTRRRARLSRIVQSIFNIYRKFQQK